MSLRFRRPQSQTNPEPADGSSPVSPTARLKQSWQITYPLIVSSLSPIVLALADTVILGWYSTAALATVSLVLPIFVLAMAMILPWGTAVQILVARWRGAEEHQQINRILDVGLWFCALVGLGAALLLQLLAPVIVNLVAQGEPMPGSVTVLRVLLMCLPLAAVTAHYRGVFGGLGQTGIAMRVALLVTLTNIPASYLLVFGLDLGAVGSAVGTALATALGAIYIVWFGRRRLGHEYAFWRRVNLRRPKEILAPLSRIGWPDTVFAITAYGGDVLLVAIVATLGATSLAGYRLMVTTVTVLWVVVFSASSGLSILVGQRLGARDLTGADAARRSGGVLMAGMASLVVLPALFAPSAYFGLFTPEDAVIAEARSVVYVLVGLVPAMVISMIMAGVLRAAGDTRSVMYAGVAGQLAVGVPVAWLTAVHLGLGLLGVYLGLLASWLTRMVVTYLRYRRRRWAELPAEPAAPAGKGDTG
ncbi:MATE family efflux transporter [Natronosporangium hydrolyticum]|uniref:Probable multidrug resistance protein NorM n=1 Tax=Natronosporangium hydrolyticum TaxID=2811111 RepID=A0A895YLH9_9ACTN|nr:MATE family efflux transporter [Natronosporangium hydrolyticum]QSB16825.1 MATE family efflux transporter [Natronosporangium hydrolyticum]